MPFRSAIRQASQPGATDRQLAHIQSTLSNGVGGGHFAVIDRNTFFPVDFGVRGKSVRTPSPSHPRPERVTLADCDTVSCSDRKVMPFSSFLMLFRRSLIKAGKLLRELANEGAFDRC